MYFNIHNPLNTNSGLLFFHCYSQTLLQNCRFDYKQSFKDWHQQQEKERKAFISS